MNPDTTEALRALSAKYLENRFKLSGPETAEVEDLAVAALNTGVEGMAFVLSLAGSLPTEAVAGALAIRWCELSDEARQETLAKLNQLPEMQRKRLLLQLGRAVARVDVARARPLLVRACRLLAPRLDHGLNDKDQELFRRVMLGVDGALFAFDFAEAAQAEVGALLACFVSAECAPSRPKPGTFPPEAPQALEWLWRQGLCARLSVAQKVAVSAFARSLPHEMREQLSKRLDPVPTEYAPLPSPATPAAGPEPAGEAAPETLPKIVSEAAVQSLPGSRVVPDTNPAREPQGPAALQTAKGTARERVSQFLDDLREILSGEERLRAEMRALRAAAQSAREKVSVAERDLCRAEQTARQAIDERDRERAERSAAEGQVELLRAEIAKLHADSDAARHAHGREADSLAARIGVEADRSVEGFKNSLVGKLRLEWRDFSDVREKEMDVALGESLRRQLRGLFSVLEHAGFSFKD